MPILNVFELQIFLIWTNRLEFPKPNKQNKTKQNFLQYSKTKITTQQAIKQRAGMKCFRVILGLRCQILAQIDNWYIKHIKFCPIFSILSEPPWIFYICLDQGKTWLVHTVNGANMWRSHGSCKVILYSSSCRLLLSSISLSLSLSLSLRSHHPIIKNKK